MLILLLALWGAFWLATRIYLVITLKEPKPVKNWRTKNTVEYNFVPENCDID